MRRPAAQRRQRVGGRQAQVVVAMELQVQIAAGAQAPEGRVGGEGIRTPSVSANRKR